MAQTEAAITVRVRGTWLAKRLAKTALIVAHISPRLANIILWPAGVWLSTNRGPYQWTRLHWKLNTEK